MHTSGNFQCLLSCFLNFPGRYHIWRIAGCAKHQGRYLQNIFCLPEEKKEQGIKATGFINPKMGSAENKGGCHNFLATCQVFYGFIDKNAIKEMPLIGIIVHLCINYGTGQFWLEGFFPPKLFVDGLWMVQWSRMWKWFWFFRPSPHKTYKYAVEHFRGYPAFCVERTLTSAPSPVEVASLERYPCAQKVFRGMLYS